jgi:hypothetical protein
VRRGKAAFTEADGELLWINALKRGKIGKINIMGTHAGLSGARVTDTDKLSDVIPWL